MSGGKGFKFHLKDDRKYNHCIGLMRSRQPKTFSDAVWCHYSELSIKYAGLAW